MKKTWLTVIVGGMVMSSKRRDKKNRVLHNGEIQKEDGRYRYKYILNGKEMYLYSWRLVESDPMPVGKRPGPSLRELEKQVNNNLELGYVPFGGGLTVCDLASKYIDLRSDTVRPNTKKGYFTVLNFIKRDPFGGKRIDRVSVMDAKLWVKNLQKVQGKSYSSINSIRSVLRGAFKMAYDDDLVRKNPFEFQLCEVIENDTKRRVALTEEQEYAFLQFVKNDKHFVKYYSGMYILFKTGMRVSELCGLTRDDIDFNNHTISINKQLMKNDGKYYLQRTKTNSGNRVLPMTLSVEKCFKTIIDSNSKLNEYKKVDGVSGFLWFDRNNNVMCANQWEKCFSNALKKYNSSNELEIACLTPHVCRHTFCTRMVMSGMNPKTLQYVMGHADITTTMNIYSHANLDDAKKEYDRLNLI